VNPFDAAALADAIHEGLTMPEEERRRRLEAICAQVREHTLEEWSWFQMEDLTRAAELRSSP
jgi:trehalose-6-phosphate synthase